MGQFYSGSVGQYYSGANTYVRTRAGWLYLAVVMDLFSRKIVGWAMAPAMPTELIASALRMAIQQRKPAPGLLLHSDRGSQYASLEYQSLLDQHGICCSMSRKGNCWDNAVMERFFLNLKMERVWQQDYASQGRLNAILPITSSVFITESGFTRNWATCLPPPMNGKWQQYHLSRCLK